jgi:hypothetical protein
MKFQLWLCGTQLSLQYATVWINRTVERLFVL